MAPLFGIPFSSPHTVSSEERKRSKNRFSSTSELTQAFPSHHGHLGACTRILRIVNGFTRPCATRVCLNKSSPDIVPALGPQKVKLCLPKSTMESSSIPLKMTFASHPFCALFKRANHSDCNSLVRVKGVVVKDAGLYNTQAQSLCSAPTRNAYDGHKGGNGDVYGAGSHSRALGDSYNKSTS